jgi:hypothetical protein
LRLKNIHNLYGGGENGRNFSLGKLLNQAGKELPVQQFEAAKPKTRPSKQDTKVREPLRELIPPPKPTPKNRPPKVNTESLNSRLKNWASKGYGATGLFKEYPKSWNNVATVVSGMPKFKGNGVTANNLKRVFPVYATNHEKFLKKRFHYERPANKPANLRGSKKSATKRVGENFKARPNPLFVPTENRSRRTQLTTRENRFPSGAAAPAAQRNSSVKTRKGTYLNRVAEKLKV